MLEQAVDEQRGVSGRAVYQVGVKCRAHGCALRRTTTPPDDPAFR
jgi:hypothetical protein